MTLEDMNVNKFYNILRNLNDMESIFLERYQDEASYDATATYHKFLDNYFISSNDLSEIYYPRIDLKNIGASIESLGLLKQLSEISQIASDLDVNIVKQFNFPCHALHSCDYFECVYIFEGNARFQLEDKIFELEPGDFFFHAPGDAYAVNAEVNSIVLDIDIRKRYIYETYPRLFSNFPVALKFFDRCFREETNGNYIIFHTDNRDSIKETVMRIFIEYMWGDKYRNEIIRANFEMLIAYMKRYVTGEVETVQVLSSVDKNYNEILDYLTRNYRDATLDSTAREVHFSKQYVSRIIHQITGSSFSKLVKEIRISKVKEYLKETTLSLENIAELTGFSSTSYLWRTFKELTGNSPSDYRKNE